MSLAGRADHNARVGRTAEGRGGGYVDTPKHPSTSPRHRPRDNRQCGPYPRHALFSLGSLLPIHASIVANVLSSPPSERTTPSPIASAASFPANILMRGARLGGHRSRGLYTRSPTIPGNLQWRKGKSPPERLRLLGGAAQGPSSARHACGGGGGGTAVVTEAALVTPPATPT